MSKSGHFDQNQTKNQTFLKEKSDIIPWSAKADYSESTASVRFFKLKSFGCLGIGSFSELTLAPIGLDN